MTYGDLLEKGQFKINKDRLFSCLTEEEELLITRELINFLLWSCNKKNMIKNFLKVEDLDYKTLTEFWLKWLGKSSKIEELIKNITVVADIYEYVKKYSTKIKLYKSYSYIQMFSYNKYRTEEQYNELKKIMQTNAHFNKIILNFFKKYKFDLDHIDKNNAKMLINKFK